MLGQIKLDDVGMGQNSKTHEIGRTSHPQTVEFLGWPNYLHPLGIGMLQVVGQSGSLVASISGGIGKGVPKPLEKSLPTIPKGTWKIRFNVEKIYLPVIRHGNIKFPHFSSMIFPWKPPFWGTSIAMFGKLQSGAPPAPEFCPRHPGRSSQRWSHFIPYIHRGFWGKCGQVMPGLPSNSLPGHVPKFRTIQILPLPTFCWITQRLKLYMFLDAQIGAISPWSSQVFGLSMSCWFHSSGHLDDLGCLKIGKPTKRPIWLETRPSQIVNTYICIYCHTISQWPIVYPI